MKKRLRYWGGVDSSYIWQQMLDEDEDKDVIVLNADYLDTAASLLQRNGYQNNNQHCNRTPAWCLDGIDNDNDNDNSTIAASHRSKNERSKKIK